MTTPGKYNEQRMRVADNLSWPQIHRMAKVAFDLEIGTLLRYIIHDWISREHDEYDEDPGEVAWTWISDIIARWQGKVGLVEDGMFGPVSLKRYNQLYSDIVSSTTPALALEVLRVAQECIGLGEEHQNNAGEWLHSLRDYPYGLGDFKRPIGAWCEFFLNWCCRTAAERLNMTLPFDWGFYDSVRNRRMPIGSAKVFGRRVADAGARVEKWSDLRVGDFVIWERGQAGSPAGHVDIVETIEDDGAITVIGGNIGPFPARVARRTVHESRKFLFGARIL